KISIRRINSGGFILLHCDDGGRDDLQRFHNPEEAAEIARYDDAGNYRPLKTAPNLRHGWRLELVDLAELRRALDYFYPGRLAMFTAWKENRLTTTPLRETLTRQSGMYRVASKISDEQINDPSRTSRSRWKAIALTIRLLGLPVCVARLPTTPLSMLDCSTKSKHATPVKLSILASKRCFPA